MQLGERAELLGDRQRRVVRQHHPTGTDANLRRVRGDVRNQHARRRRGDRRHVVVLGVPDPFVAERFGPLRDRATVASSASRDGRAVADDGKIEDRQRSRHVRVRETRAQVLARRDRPPDRAGRTPTGSTPRPEA